MLLFYATETLLEVFFEQKYIDVMSSDALLASGATINATKKFLTWS